MKICKKLLVTALLSSFLWGNDTVLQIQTQLIELGYGPANADGIMGKQTADAIRSYQEDMGLNVTGRASNSLLKHLSPVSQSVYEPISTPVASQKPKNVSSSAKGNSFKLPGFLSRGTATNSVFSYSYIEGGYSTTEAELIEGISIDGNVLYLLGSFDITPNINLLADYQKYSYDYDNEATIWSAGVGYHQKMQEKTDIIIALKYYSGEITKFIGENVSTDNDDSAFGFKSGVRYEVSSELEANALFSFRKWDEIDDSDKSFIIGARYNINNFLKSSNNITVGARFTVGDDSGFGISLRGEF
jgi:peptidoglycan hydrolase-like protein with peptidoglycan-binding domain